MTIVHKVKTEGQVHPWDRIPIVLKGISGFSSCVTVSAMSALFVWSVHISVSTGVSGWPGFITSVLMFIGPIIITLNFVNARSVITTIVESASSSDNAEVDGSGNPVTVQIPIATGLVSDKDVAIEREIIGPTTVLLRAIAGTLSTHVICGCSLLFTWTIHNSMISGHSLPGNGQLFMVVIGPIITSWNFVRANATLSTVIRGASAFDKFRNRLASILATNKN